jgi:hypothetical protein
MSAVIAYIRTKTTGVAWIRICFVWYVPEADVVVSFDVERHATPSSHAFCVFFDAAQGAQHSRWQ